MRARSRTGAVLVLDEIQKVSGWSELVKWLWDEDTQGGESFETVRGSGDSRGCWVESCVGAHLVNTSAGTQVEITYWCERNQEVDFVLQRGSECVAIVVKSGRRRDSLPGMAA